MRVILFRHGPAGERDVLRWPDDSLRPLTPRGEERTHAAASGLARIEPGIGLIVTSPLARAAQTARVLAQVFEDAAVETLDALRPMGSHRQILEFLSSRSADEALALVGHEPDLGKLAGVLVFGAPVALPLKKAGACAIEFEGDVKAAGGRLCWAMPPRLLRKVAGKRDRV
jgi:phosphohistidine phosphatase